MNVLKFFPEIVSCDNFWKVDLCLETIFEQKFCSGNHVSEHFLVPVMDFHINFLFLKHDSEHGVDPVNGKKI